MTSPLSDLLKRSTKLHPEKIAVRYKDEEVSYERFDFLSDRLCTALVHQGVKLGDRVGIYLDKSVEALLAIFGILKSGACYVPLDPLAPVERQLYVIEDCSLEYLVTSSKKLPQIRQILKRPNPLRSLFVMDLRREGNPGKIEGVPLFFKDEILESTVVISEEPPGGVTGEHLAYILYTSGSTGRPKGVMISHRASLAFINWAYQCFKVQPEDRISSLAPFHFDLSIFDIFVTIKAAATICVVSQGLSSFPKSLANFIEQEKISIWYSVPSVLIQLVLSGHLRERDLSSLRTVLFAGEVFPTQYLRMLMEMVPHAHYYNLYGPTETNVCTSYHVKSLPNPEKPIPIGKPCEGEEIYIVDEEESLLKEGEVGQLYVSGPTLMTGYWNDSEKTDRVMFKNPFSQKGGQKIYKTGDLVSLNQDGDLDFHGRIDHMIKSRGYRIELGEIESVLYSHPAVREAVVVGIPNEKIGKTIQAFIVLKEGQSVSEQEIKFFSSQKLPPYMIPESVTFKNSLPKTSTNKTDREILIKEGLCEKN